MKNPYENINNLEEEKEREARDEEAELINNGQAVRCIECGELLTKGDRGFDEYLCEKCAEKDVKNMLDCLQKIINSITDRSKNDLQTIKDFCNTYSDIFEMFMLGEVIEYGF